MKGRERKLPQSERRDGLLFLSNDVNQQRVKSSEKKKKKYERFAFTAKALSINFVL